MRRALDQAGFPEAPSCRGLFGSYRDWDAGFAAARGAYISALELLLVPAADAKESAAFCANWFKGALDGGPGLAHRLTKPAVDAADEAVPVVGPFVDVPGIHGRLQRP